MNPNQIDNFYSSDSPSQSSSQSTNNPPTHSSPTPPQFSPYQFSGCYRPQFPPQDFQQFPQQFPYFPQPFQQQFPHPFPPYQSQPNPQPFPPFSQQIPPFSSQQPQSPPLSTQPLEGSSSRSKSKNKKPRKTEAEKSSRLTWSERESLSLARLWIHVSEDPNISTNQTGPTFWFRIMKLFNEEWSHKTRTKDALTGKWDLIRRKVLKFNGIYAQLVHSGSRASGSSDSDILKAALSEYRVTVGGDFPHLQCWEFLKDKQKFFNPDPCVVGRRNRRRDTGETQETPYNLDEDEDNEGGNDRPRPPGRSRPSKSQRTSSSSAGNASSGGELSARLAELSTRQTSEAANRAEIAIHALRAQKAQELNLDMDTLARDTSALPPPARDYIERKKAAILQKLSSGYYDD